MRLLKTKFPQNLRPILYVELNSDEFNSHQLKKKKSGVGTKVALGMVYKKKISFQYHKKEVHQNFLAWKYDIKEHLDFPYLFIYHGY